MGFLIPSHPLTNLEIQKHYKNEPKFNGVLNKGWGIYNKYIYIFLILKFFFVINKPTNTI